MGQTADHEAPTLNVTTVNVKAPQPAEPSQQSIEPQPKPVAVPPQSAEPPPQSPLVADQVQQVSAPPVGTDEIDLVPPADAEPPVFDAVAALDPPISEVDDFELDSQPISVAPSEPSVEETETAPEPERPAINPSRILAAPMIEFDVDTQNHHVLVRLDRTAVGRKRDEVKTERWCVCVVGNAVVVNQYTLLL